MCVPSEKAEYRLMKKILFSIAVLSMIALAGCASKPTEPVYPSAQIDTLAQCLTTNGLKMYGTLRCPHCQNQKKLFGESVSKITFIDCDPNRVQCISAGIENFPTWIAADGQKYVGEQSLGELATIAGCSL